MNLKDELKEQFFKKYGFTASCSRKHPIYNDPISFEGLEADYVNRIENELSYIKEAYNRLLQKMDYMTTQEMYRLKDQLKAKDHE